MAGWMEMRCLLLRLDAVPAVSERLRVLPASEAVSSEGGGWWILVPFVRAGSKDPGIV